MPAVAPRGDSCRHQSRDLVAQRLRRERLREVATRAVRHVARDLILLHGRGDEHDARRRELGSSADRVGQLYAVHLRHRDVGEHDVRLNALDELEPLAVVTTISPPVGEYFTAFESRFATICVIRSRSAEIGGIAGSSTSVIGCPGAFGRTRAAASLTIAPRSSCSRLSVMRPASIRSRSSISLIIRLRRSASLLMSDAYSFISDIERSSSRIISLNPWMPVSGVRNSWLTIDTNSLFARFTRSSCSTARRWRSNASAFRSAAAAWSPNSVKRRASSIVKRVRSSYERITIAPISDPPRTSGTAMTARSPCWRPPGDAPDHAG